MTWSLGIGYIVFPRQLLYTFSPVLDIFQPENVPKIFESRVVLFKPNITQSYIASLLFRGSPILLVLL